MTSKNSNESSQPLKKIKTHKYNAKKTCIGDLKFDSKLEADYYQEILIPQLQDGVITDVQLHPQYVLINSFEKQGRKFRKLTYSADFLITYPSGEQLLIDTKGMLTKDFIIKYKLFNYLYEDLNLVLIGKKGKQWVEIDA